MKIQCDVCNKEEASVFCSADEAALCGACDHRVHLANKLASKHRRFSLQHPKDAPRCDVCQERRAFLFCKEDRAILCRECDIPLHTANEHTQKHNRFLLTGVKLSSSMITPHPTTTTTTTSSSKGCDASVNSEIINNKQPMRKTELVPNPQQKNTKSVEGGGSTSSISEYLEMLPGWHVEDFLDSSSAPRLLNGYCKNDDPMPFLDSDIESDMGCFPSYDHLAIWVPQAPASGHKVEKQKNGNGLFKELNEVVNTNTNMKSSKRWSDHGFTVPQINPPSSNKRSRFLW